MVVGDVPVFVHIRSVVRPSRKLAGSVILPAIVNVVPLETEAGLLEAKFRLGADNVMEVVVRTLAVTFTPAALPPATTEGKIPLPRIAMTRTR